MSLPAAVCDLVSMEPKLGEYVEEYLQGTPFNVIAVRLKCCLGKKLADEFAKAFCSQDSETDPSTKLIGSLGEMHGLLGDASWTPPRIATRAVDLARPGYDSSVAHEYLDTPEVLRAKVGLLAQLIRKARRLVIYAGAGLSTASGVGDYATRTGENSVLARQDESSHHRGFILPCSARPNAGHLGLSSMAQAGLIWRLVQQNHDGLLQKAGVPQRFINEIHGSWFDPANPVVKMTESLRSDLYEDTCVIDRDADLVLVLGSSLAGMNTDRIVSSCASRARNSSAPGDRLGTVIVSLQRTPHDADSSVRVFATIDNFMRHLCSELALDLSEPREASNSPAAQPFQQNDGVDDIFRVPFDIHGVLVPGKAVGTPRVLDLREGATLLVTMGADKGQKAVVLGKHSEGHYKLGVQRSQAHGGVTSIRYLGQWWISAALAGEVEQIPVVTA